jgi:hypothetical protein
LDGPLPKWCPAVALSRQDGRHSAVALLLKAGLIQVRFTKSTCSVGVKSWLENQPYYNIESIFRVFKRKEMKASRRLAENDIITRGVTVKIQQVAVHGN